jgi:predicted permease
MRVELDRRVLLFSLAVSLAAGLAASAWPALRSIAGAEADAARSAGSRTIGSVRHRRLRRSLLVSEIAVSALLLVGAGLMLQTFRALWQADVGFSPGGVLAFRVGLPVYYGVEQRRQFHRELLHRLESLPGVGGAAVNSNLPFTDTQAERQTVHVDGHDATTLAARPYVNVQRVSAQYFDVMALPVLHGRAFDARDRGDTQPVAIVNRRFASRFWPGQDAIGKRLRQFSDGDDWLTVVGIVGDVRHESLTAPEGYDVYLPSEQSPESWNHVVVRVDAGDPMRLADAARRAVWAINPHQPVGEMQSMRDVMLDTAWQQRASAFLLGAFACLALALATIGIYGVTAYAVGQRRREFGIQRALGASRVALALVVVRDVGWTAGAGLLVGLTLAALAGRAVQPLLYGVEPLDAVTFAGVAMVLATVAIGAALVPARRAAHVDPLVAMRND